MRPSAVRSLILGLALTCAGSVFAQAGPLSVSVSAQPPAPVPVRDAAWKLLAGYQLGGGYGLEAALGDGSRQGMSIGGLSAAGDVRMRAWSLAGSHTHSFDRRWSVTGKLGFGSGLADLGRLGIPLGSLTPLPGPLSARTDVLMGLGVGYNTGRGFGLRFEYENYGAAGAPAGARDQWALSLRYSF